MRCWDSITMMWESKEISPSRLAQDEKDVQLIMNELSHLNMFTHDVPDLTCLSKKDVALK